MILGFSHIEIPSNNFEESIEFYTKYFDMIISKKENDNIELEQGFFKVLIINKFSKEHFSSVRIEVSSVSEIYNKILSENKLCKNIYPPLLKNSTIKEAKITDPSGNFITLWRYLTEDELDTSPEIKSSIKWDIEAEDILNKLLKKVPLIFRKFARERIIKEAEYISFQKNKNNIDKNICIEAYIISTPEIMKHRVKENIINIGIDIESFKDLF